MLGNLFNPRQVKVDTVPDQVTPLVPDNPKSSSEDNLSVQSSLGSKMNPTMRQNLSALSHLDVRTTQVLRQAQDEVRRIKQQYIEPSHILLGLLYDEEIFKLLEKCEIDASQLAQEIQKKEHIGTFLGQSTLSDESMQLFETAYRGSKARGVSFLTPEDLLLSFLDIDSEITSRLKAKGIQKEQIIEKLGKTNSFKSVKKSILEQYGIDLTEEARQGRLDPITGRDKEIERLIHILLRRSKNNPVIIGEAGVGKTAIVEGLAQKIVAGDAPEDLHNKRIFQLDLASLVAGASHRGEFEERLKNVISETMATGGQTILFVDEIHTLIGAGDSDGTMDASNIIKPHLARGEMQIIGTTTTSEYRKYFEKDKAFERRFQPIIAQEPSEEVAFEMLKVIRPKYEEFHSVSYPDEVLEAAVKLSKKYIGERQLPDKAVDLLDEAGAEVKLQLISGKRADKNVTKEDIQKVVSSWTGIPITKLTEDESLKLLKLEDIIHERLIDQQEAVTAVSEAVRRGRIGLAAANRPIASFIFLGPTGVGKTELAKTLAEILFGRDDAMVRLDMSEYMQKHEVAKLIGAPPGYVGYEEGGQLTEAVRSKPYSIVLLDEVEKAHPDVFNILLQLLEDGRLTDNKGNTISFKNTIVIATSNIGSELIQQELDENRINDENSHDQAVEQFTKVEEMINEKLNQFFKPELLNRFDDIVMFKPLSRKDMVKIARLSILKTASLLQEQGYKVEVTDNAISQLAHDGYDRVYGARPLRRLIQTAIENPIAMLLIGRNFLPGDTIVIDYNFSDNNYKFTKSGENINENSFENRQDDPTNSSGVVSQPQNEESPTVSSSNYSEIAQSSERDLPQPAYPQLNSDFDPTALGPDSIQNNHVSSASDNFTGDKFEY